MASCLLAACVQAGGPAPAASAAATSPSEAAASAAPAPVAPVRTLVALGASDVVGLGADRPDAEGWAPVLAGLLPGAPSLVRLGISGATARDVRAKLLPQAVAARADVAVVDVGVNDLIAGIPMAEFRRELAAIVAALRGSGARVVVVSMPEARALPALAPYAGRLGAVVPAWRAAIADAARARGADVADLYARTSEILAHPEYISADGLHPSTAGYRALARILAEAIAGRAPG